tara:strand:- start:320 stop:706 length:387 start_codon:yes stop_codon:yes gene_type:complete
MQLVTEQSKATINKIPKKRGVTSKKATLSKAKVTAVPKPVKSDKASARTLYKLVGDVPQEKKFTPQMKALILTASQAKKGELDHTSFTAQDLVALAVKQGTLTTGQDPLRIFTFYQKRLVEEGYFAKA